ncbi:polyadenylate-binding protein-interacting protein 1 isoform X1 [Athalia rosae]|uniref:polyadenylate-binding protein-interacting protein 1 isoform X1 n=2 Tax=Athalia rosae TaxID=37344 RepID=UPI0020346D17|nr:polyadenylate-binding protein-interacting protein 1 isoform X1 [Athalia rosae]XP_012264053.2 polyadenylate-binding protein-interacting protein 1 isoform X1 [Athalia rosae]
MDPLGGDHRMITQPRGGLGRGRGGWSPLPAQESRSLRRPHHASSISGNTGMTDNTGTRADGAKGDIVKYSTLSVDAAEFVPKSFSPAPPQQQSGSGYSRPSVQNRLNYARQGQQGGQQQGVQQQHYGSQQQQQQRYIPAQHMYAGPPQHQQYNQYSNTQDYGYYDRGSGDHGRPQEDQNGVGSAGDGEEWPGMRSMMGQLEGAMRTLTLSPGRFDSLVAPLVDGITPCLTNTAQTQAIVGAILRQSISEGNFRYSGARLCTFLDNASLSERGPSIFRDTLVGRCREETEKTMTSWVQRSTPEDEVKEKSCHGLILFLAELVTQMESEPASVLGKLLIELMSAVLQRPGQNSAKHICQALKLAGQTLERDNSGGGSEMESVMQRLTGLVTEGLVDVHVGRMVNSVDELRRGNWGRIVSTHGLYNSTVNANPQTPADTTQEPMTNEPVFYGPDGNVLSPEESRFLQDLTGDAPDIDDYGEGELDDVEVEGSWVEDGDDGGMDDAIAAAYEEFLKLAPNKRNGTARR